MRRPQRATLGAVSLLVALRCIASAADLRPPEGLPSATVTRVVDGDTVVVAFPTGRQEKVRLIGVDSPEAHDSAKLNRDAWRTRQDRGAIRAMGMRATKYTQDHVLGRTVSIEYDVQARDRYGRTLAYLWLLPQGILFNAELLRAGYAEVLTIPPNVKHVEHFLALAREAREGHRGLWGDGLTAAPSENRQRRSR